MISIRYRKVDAEKVNKMNNGTTDDMPTHKIYPFGCQNIFSSSPNQEIQKSSNDTTSACIGRIPFFPNKATVIASVPMKTFDEFFSAVSEEMTK